MTADGSASGFRVIEELEAEREVDVLAKCPLTFLDWTLAPG